jgi:hypothetical protein
MNKVGGKMETINKPEIMELEDGTVAYVSFVGNYIGNVQVFRVNAITRYYLQKN